jgi:hypothetical protein
MTEPPKHPESSLREAEPPLSAEELRSVGAAIAEEFPLARQQPGLILVDVDPFHLHVYWNQSLESIDSARRAHEALGELAHLVIRFRELAPDDAPEAAGPIPLEVFDLELDSPRGDAEVRLSGSGRRFEAELGLTAGDGGWWALARSNPVRLPPAAPVAEPGFDTWDMRDAAPPVERISEQAVEQESPEPAASEWDLSLRGGATDKLIPRFPDPRPRDAVPDLPGDDASRQLEVQLTVTDRESGETPDLALPGVAQQPSGHQVGASSFGLVRELHAELHLWGRAEPETTVSWAGTELPVMPDGQFSLTLPLDTSNPMLPLLVAKPRHKKPK